MKTTIDIADALARRARDAARQRGTTLRALVEDGLRRVLADDPPSRRAKPFRMVTFRGRGTQPGVEEGDWEALRALLYEGRGG